MTKEIDLSLSGNLEASLINNEQNNKIINHIVSYINNWHIYHFHDTGKTSPIKQTNNINDNLHLKPQRENLAAFLYALKNNYKNHYDEIITVIKRVAPFFKDFVLEPENDFIRLRWKHIAYDDYFDVSALSDGTLRFICLVTLLLQPNPPKTILIDKPELGLHPYALELLANLFNIASYKTQIIATTQSPTFANFFDIDDILVVDLINKSSILKRLNADEFKVWL